ncbi:unnamed protein product, partial [marine sediment metagenome]
AKTQIFYVNYEKNRKKTFATRLSGGKQPETGRHFSALRSYTHSCF